MALEPTHISVPLGKGVDESVDPHHTEPPLAHVVENMRPELAGSLRKRPGWQEVSGQLSGGALGLVGDGSRALVLGTTPARIVSSSGSSALAHSSPLPLTVRTRRLRAIAGLGHTAQMAHRDGYTAVIVSVLGEVATYPHAQGIEHDYACEVAIYDRDWRVVWGPHRITALKWLPRVEAITVGGQTRFVFFALGSQAGHEPYQDNPSVHLTGTMADSVDLYAAQGWVGGAAPTAYHLGAVAPVEGVEFPAAYLHRWKIYDTHSTGEDPHAYVTWVAPFLDAPGTYPVWVAATNGLSTFMSRAWDSQPDEREFSVSVWRDTARDTVLVHASLTAGGGGRIYYTDGAGLGGASIAVPGLDRVDTAATALGGFAGTWQQVPEFFEVAGQLRLNELLLALSGSGPAVPSVSATDAPSLPHVFKPQDVGGIVLYSRGSLVMSRSGVSRGSLSNLELYRLEPSGRPHVDLTVLETRWGREGFIAFSHPTWPRGIRVASAPCVVGQVARIGGSIAVALLPLTDTQNPRASLFESGGGAAQLYTATSAGAGFYNDEQALAIVEVDTTLPTYSSQAHDSGRVIAAGQPSIWAGDTVHPLVPRAPRLRRYWQGDDNDVPAHRRVMPQEVGVRAPPNNDGWGGINGPISYSRAFHLRAVLVFTDASGLEYRSAPSEPMRFLQGPVDDDNVVLRVTESGDFPEFLPVVDLELEPNCMPFFGEGRALDVELYVTERRDAKGEQVDESTYTMVSRMPVQRDAQGWFAIDMLQDLAVGVNPAPTPGPAEHSNPPHTKALYTLSGELPNLPPPASHVMAQVGHYMFLVPAEAPYELWNSKPLVRGRAPEWNPALITYAPPACGGIVSLASSYDRLYLLCRDGVWELPVLGGPNALGEGSFGAAQLVYRGQGCISHMGTVETPEGVFYLSSSGPRLLTGSGSVDVGRAVRTALDWRSVVAATFDPQQDEVTWWTREGSVSYSLRHEAWSTSTMGSEAATVWDGGVLRVGPDRFLLEERARSSADGPRLLLARYTSPWLHFGSPQSQMRVWEIQVLGRLHEAAEWGLIRVSTELDYVEQVVDSYEWSAAQIAAMSKGLQLSVKPRHQQCSAIRITIDEVAEETDKTDEGGKPVYLSDLSWTLSGLSVTVGAQRGLLKLQAEAKK